jgi:ribose transport system ATP-binding protein
MTASAGLRLVNLRKSFGATRALTSVSLTVAPGEVHALIGENGAGKSTLMKVLSGAHGADGGSMSLAGRPYAPSGPHDARLKGVAMIYQELNLALHLPAWENIVLGAESAAFGWIDRRAGRSWATAASRSTGPPAISRSRRSR